MLRPIVALSAAFFTSLLLFQNCSSANFSSEPSSTKADAPNGGQASLGSGGASTGRIGVIPSNPAAGTICSAATASSQPLKVLFVVDNSGSTDTTDPDKNFRDGSLRKFFEKFSGNSNFSWGFIYFAKDTKSYFGTNEAPEFTRSITDMRSAIDDFKTLKTSSGTNYTHSLAAARSAMMNDPDRNDPAHPPFYSVIFMSDGEPNPNDPKVVEEVQSIMDVTPGRVSVNTVYFGANAPENETRLQSMAEAGKGKFFNTNIVGTDIDFATMAEVPLQACQK